MTALEVATELVNRWASECLSIDPRKRSALLIQMIAGVLHRVETEAYERAYRATEAYERGCNDRV